MPHLWGFSPTAGAIDAPSSTDIIDIFAFSDLARVLHQCKCMHLAALQTPFHPKYLWMWRVLALVLIFNLIDAALTLIAVHAGIATEANPLMAPLLAIGTIPFVVTKLGLVSLGVGILWHRRHTPLATIGSIAALMAYAFVMGCHIETVRLLVG